SPIRRLPLRVLFFGVIYSSSSFRKSLLGGPHSPATTISFISTRPSKLTNGKRCHFELCHVERRRLSRRSFMRRLEDVSDYSPQTAKRSFAWDDKESRHHRADPYCGTTTQHEEFRD